MTRPRGTFSRPNRKKPLKRKTWLKPSRKKIQQVNKAKAAKKLAKYRAFMASPEWKVIRLGALERAGHQCEQVVEGLRCPMTTTLQTHHLVYSRFGGQELPSDLRVLCKGHHEAEHAKQGGRMLWQRAS